MSDADKVIGANVRALREAAGLTQADVAQRMTDRGVPGFYPQTVLKVEKGQRRVALAESLPLADSLGVTVADLLDNDAHNNWMKDRAALQAFSDLRDAHQEYREAVSKIERARTELERLLPDLRIGHIRDLVEQALNPKETP